MLFGGSWYWSAESLPLTLVIPFTGCWYCCIGWDMLGMPCWYCGMYGFTHVGWYGISQP